MKTFVQRFNLEACPFCGSNDLKRVILILSLKPNPVKVKCCGCGFESGSFHYDMDKAAIEWNEISNFVVP